MIPQASAHLMVAQHGTLNFKGDGVFMVLSLPVSAFKEFDDDGDGKMSTAEFTKHRATLMTSLHKNVQLIDENGLRPLQGLLLSPVASHTSKKAPAEQLVVMGRFALTNINVTNSNQFTFHMNLFGKKPSEKQLKMTATRKGSTSSMTQKHKMVLTSKQTSSVLFSNTSKSDTANVQDKNIQALKN